MTDPITSPDGLKAALEVALKMLRLCKCDIFGVDSAIRNGEAALAASAERETEPSDDDDRDEVDAILQSVLVMLGLPGFRKEWFVNDRWNFGALRQHGLDARLTEIRAAEKLAAGRETAPPHALDVDIADVVACFARWEADGRSVMPPYLESALRDLVRSWKDHRKALVTRRETPAPPSELQYPIPLNAQQLEASIQDEIKAYEALQDELEATHRGEWILMKDRKQIGLFSSFEQAAAEGLRLYGRGSYLIREIGAEPIRLPVSVIHHQYGG